VSNSAPLGVPPAAVAPASALAPFPAVSNAGTPLPVSAPAAGTRDPVVQRQKILQLVDQMADKYKLLPRVCMIDLGKSSLSCL
jgi:hypothetical protein